MTNSKMRSWNPLKRNRKIGTDDQEFKSRNRFDIPSPLHEDIFWQRLHKPVVIPLSLDDHKFTFFVEEPLCDYKHHVNINDITNILRHLPKDERKDITSFVLRQPRRKEVIFSPCWGRLSFYSDYTKYGAEDGASIILEAQPINNHIKIKKLSDFQLSELLKLQGEGHDIIIKKRQSQIFTSPKATRTTLLYRTLLHEIGHYKDYRNRVIIPSYNDDDKVYLLLEEYFSRPPIEREIFAERYAEHWRSKLKKQNIIPFQPAPMDYKAFPGLRKEWFYFG